MPNTLRIRRGQSSSLPNATVAEALFTIDTYDLYIGKGDGTNQRFQKYIASGSTSQILRGDGSLYTFPLAISSPTNGQVLKYNGTSWVNSTDIVGTGTVTSVAMTVPTGLSISGSPITTNGTLALSFTAGYSIPTTSSQATWDTAYNRSLTAVAVTGTTTKTLTLTKQDGTTLTASWTDINTDAVTSVFGRTGAVIATSGDYNTSQVTESGNLYYTDARARLALSSTATGLTYTNTTGVFSLTAGYLIPTTTSQTNWDAAYNDKINSAAVTGTTTKTLTLTQQDGGTITASWTDINTDAVTSVFGRTGAVVAANGDYTTTQVTEGTNLYYTEARVSANTNVAANTAARHNAVTLGTANGLSLSTQILSLGLSSGSTTGALSSTDWTTFNNKQNALTNPVTGTGTTNYLPKFTGTSTIGNSQIFDNGTNVGIGTTSPQNLLEIRKDQAADTALWITNRNAASTSATNSIIFGGYRDSDVNHQVAKISVIQSASSAAGDLEHRGSIAFYTQPATTNTNPESVIERMRINWDGNVGIGTTSPTEKLDVRVAGYGIQHYGDANNILRTYAGGAYQVIVGTNSGVVSEFGYRSGFFYIQTATTERMRITSGGNVLIGTATDNLLGDKLQVSGSANITGNLTVDTNTLFVDAANNRVGIGTTSPDELLQVGGSTGAVTTPTAIRIDNTYRTGADAFDKLKFYLYKSATETYGLGLGNLADVQYWAGSTSTGMHRFFTSRTERMRLDASGNLGLGVTPSAWDTTTTSRGMQFGRGGSIFYSTAQAESSLGGNYYQSAGSVYNYLTTSFALRYSLNDFDGTHRWYTAPSGTAGNAITFTQAMTLDASGRLGVGSTTPGTTGIDTGVTQMFVVAPNSNSGNAATFIADSLGRGILVANQAKNVSVAISVNTNGNIGTNTAHNFTFYTGALEVMRITNSTRNLLIGTTTDNGTDRLQVSGSVSAGAFNFATGSRIFKSYSFGTDLVVNTTGGWASSHRIYNLSDTTQTWFFGAIGTTAYIKFGNPAVIDQTGFNGVGMDLTSSGAATFSSSVTATGSTTNSAIIAKNTTGGTGTAQYYQDFTASAGVVIGRILRGNGAAGYEANGLNIDNYAGMQIKLNTLGGSGGAFNVIGGNVGIGTTSPSQKLEVAGIIRGESVNVYGSSDPVSTSPYLYSPSTGALGIGANGSERLRITSGGNLLIGTTTDNGTDRLQVSGSASVSGQLNVMGYLSVYSDSTTLGALGFNRNVSNGAIYNSSFGAYQMQNSSGTFEIFAFNSAGTSLGKIYSLTSTGAATFSSSVTANSFKANSGADAIDIGTATGNSYRSNLILRGTNASGVSSISYYGINVYSTDGSVDLMSSNNIIFRAGGTSEYMRITSGGNVGIGTTSPANRLDVVRGTAGAMGRGTYESGSFSYNGDMKLGLYTSAAAGAGGASLMFGATNYTAGGNYPGFELQFAPSTTVASNLMKFNYVGRNSTGTVIAATTNILCIHQGNFVTIGTETNNGIDRLQVSGSGNFSSSVTASSLIKSGGTSAQILAADGSVITAGTNITISGGTISANDTDTGITSLNGLTALSQTFAVGTSGNDFNISSATSTHTFNIPDASTTARGLITTGTQLIAGQKTFRSNIVSESTGDALSMYYGIGGGTFSYYGSLKVLSSGQIQMYALSSLQYENIILAMNGSTVAGNVLIAKNTDNALGKLQVGGTINADSLLLNAGTASLAPLDFTPTSAALKTTAAAGDMEVDSNGLLYYTHNATSRGYIPTEQYLISTATRALTNSTASQNLFSTASAGASSFTPKANTTYFFEGYISIVGLSSSNNSVGFGLSSTGTVSGIDYSAISFKVNTLTTPTAAFMARITTNAITQVTANNNQTSAVINIRGTIRIGATAGVITPIISMITAAAVSTINTNTYVKFTPIGTDTIQEVPGSSWA